MGKTVLLCGFMSILLLLTIDSCKDSGLQHRTANYHVWNHVVKLCILLLILDRIAAIADCILSIGHVHEPCKNGWTNRGAIWGLSWVCPRNHVLDGGADRQRGKGNFWVLSTPLKCIGSLCSIIATKAIIY